MEVVRRLLPEMSTALRKGNCGRLGVLGGSEEYTGAPYFAGISALKVGVDLVHIFTTPEAAPVIKAYSPELIVHPQLEPADWMQRVNALIIGPGLGRAQQSMDIAFATIQSAQHLGRPLVVDADGLWVLTERWEALAASQRPDTPLILTPNAVEMDRLSVKVLQTHTLDRPREEIRLAASELAQRLQMCIFVKGAADMFATPDGKVHLFDWDGAPRRPGGIGDCLAGVLAAFLLWSKSKDVPIEQVGEAASFFVRECARLAFDDIGRGMTATDVIAKVAPLMKFIDNYNID